MRENHVRRKSKVSDGRLIRVGLVGPKPRPKGVGDGQPVNIPVPQRGVMGDAGGEAACGVGAIQVASGRKIPR
jgi:hypothetical protein